jgi:hypothetical protein
MDFDEATLPSTLTVEQDGKAIPLRDVPFIKEAKDLPSLLKQGYDAHREVGARVRIPSKDKPEDVVAFKGKLYESGILEAPPGKPDDYAIEKPKELGESIQWNDALVGEFKTTMHKHGVPKGAAQDLINLHIKAMGTMADSLLDKTGLKVDKEATVAALKNEFGDRYEVLRADAGRLANEIFKTPEELEFYSNLGLADNQRFLSILMRLAPLAQSDSSFLPDVTRTATGASPDSVRSELSEIMNNPSNTRHAGWKNRDKAVMDYIDELYKKAYGSGTVTLT